MDTFKSYTEAWNYITEQGNKASGTVDRIIIENQTKDLDLEYVTNGHTTGWPVDDVKKSFVDRGSHLYVLPPGRVGTQLWREHDGGTFGKAVGMVFSLGISMAGQMCHTESYFSVRLRTPGKNYIVCCGSFIGLNRCNKAGIQIRGEDGVLDGNGNVTGHGVDATGNVTDIQGLACAVSHSTAGDGAYHQFSEVTRSFEVTCLFNNWNNGCHRFIFKDARD